MGLLKKIKKRIYHAYLQKLIYRDNRIEIPKTQRIKLDIVGKHNTVILKNQNIRKSGRINIKIYGDNNTVVIGQNVSLSGTVNIFIGQQHHNYAPTYNVNFSIGANTSIEGMTYCTFNSGTVASIGENCMLAYGITLFDTDAHPVFDLDTHQIINYVRGIHIGNHVWIGANATVLKNCAIADDCIIGWGSVVSGQFKKSHCSIAGNPARVVRENITWDSYAYEYCQNGQIASPRVMSPEQTVDMILSKHVSLCRFGDGEFDIMLKHANLPFQKYEEGLCKKLWDAWNCDGNNLLVATCSFYFDAWNVAHSAWTKHYLHKVRNQLQAIHNPNRQYGAAELSCMYKMGADIDLDNYYAKLRQIWEKQDIVLVHGAHIFDKLQYDIFDNAKSVEHIIVPNLHAFSEYDDILSRLKTFDKTKLFILICGPTATIMAYDLARSGFWALDLGHVAKNYDWFMQKRATNTTEAILDFFSPD